MLLGVVVLGSHVVALLVEVAGVLTATLSMCTARRRDPHHKASSARKRGTGTQQTDYELNGSAQHDGADETTGSSGNGTNGWGSRGGHHGRGSTTAYDDDDDVVAGSGGSADHDGSLDGGGGSGRGGAAGVPLQTFYH
ncbi:unnamed protein product [Sphagnum jensenii]|uniref:Uncharacterized protein n=1 Tax=Sphagnum jensenii TaxID=128206 RepID=A0ABP0ZY04_9BRYO